MKKRCSMLLAIFYFLGHTEFSFSQAYQKFLYDHNEWDIYVGVIPVKTLSSQAYISGPVFANEDTVIGIYTYKKAYSRTEDGTFAGNKPCLIREDTVARKVYILSGDSINERILYDFNLVTGDSIYLDFRYENSWMQILKSGWYHVDSTGNTSTISGVRNTWFLSNPLISTPFPNVPQLKWIEGIGSTISPVYLDEECSQTLVVINPEAQFYLSLTCAFHDSVAVFHDSAWSATYIQLGWQFFGDSCIFNMLGGIPELENKILSLNIQPNPVRDHTFISLNHNSIIKINKYNLTVTDFAGRTIKNFSINGKELSDGFIFNRGDIESGSYLITLYDNKILFATGQLIIQ